MAPIWVADNLVRSQVRPRHSSSSFFAVCFQLVNARRSLRLSTQESVHRHHPWRTQTPNPCRNCRFKAILGLFCRVGGAKYETFCSRERLEGVRYNLPARLEERLERGLHRSSAGGPCNSCSLLLYFIGLRRAGVAQLVEHLICNQRVGGSNPSASSAENF